MIKRLVHYLDFNVMGKNYYAVKSKIKKDLFKFSKMVHTSLNAWY